MNVKVEQSKSRTGPGRPPKYVVHEGMVIEGLSYKPGTREKPDGRFYSTHSKRREYFGKKQDEAVRLFLMWQRRQMEQNDEVRS